MEIKFRTIEDLAKAVGVTSTTLYISKSRGATRQLGDKLEAATGIDAARWVYPDKYGNPWDELFPWRLPNDV